MNVAFPRITTFGRFQLLHHFDGDDLLCHSQVTTQVTCKDPIYWILLPNIWTLVFLVIECIHMTKLLGFSNLLLRNDGILSERVGKVREYNFSFEDYVQRFVPEKVTEGAELVKLGAVPIQYLWWCSHSPSPKGWCRDRIMSYTCNCTLHHMCHHITHYMTPPMCFWDHGGSF